MNRKNAEIEELNETVEMEKKDRQNKDPNAAVDVIARAEDASKIQRITERFRLTTVSKADVSVDAQRDRERLFPQDPSVAKTERDHLSEPKSTQDSHSTGKTGRTSRPSVREKLNEYKKSLIYEYVTGKKEV